jgi:hypothetical protein
VSHTVRRLGDLIRSRTDSLANMTSTDEVVFTPLTGLDDLIAVAPAVSAEWRESEEATFGFIRVATEDSVNASDDGREGIKVIGIPMSVTIAPHSSTASKNIVSRPEQREVILCAFDLSRKNLSKAGVCIAVRGSPGIGKSWSALLYIRMLMNQKDNRRPIIYEIGTWYKRRTTYLIYPKEVEHDGDEGKAWTVYELDDQKKVSRKWIESRVVDFAIDPPQFPTGVDPRASDLIGASGHTFIPASTDNRHLGGGNKSFQSIIELVLGSYTIAQLEIAFPFMIYPNPSEMVRLHKDDFNRDMDLMREKYKLFGGLPRYLLPGNCAQREAEMTTANARRHADVLVRSLSEPWTINKDIKIASLFFTLRPGVDEDGNPSPMREHSFVEFVSAGAVKAAGKVVYYEIHKRVTARTEEDSSQIGLAFEHVGLMLLRYGTGGLSELGISARCKELKAKDEGTEDMEFENAGTTNAAQFERCEDKDKYESLLKEIGPSLDITSGKLSLTKGVMQSPTGYSNVDGMCGADVGIQMTLQAHHSVLGHQLVKQRQVLGLTDSDDYALIFVVPPGRFDKWNSFQKLSWKEDAAVGKVVAGGVKRLCVATDPTNITKKKQQRLRNKLRQFVVTLDIKPESFMDVQVSTAT